MNSFYCKFIAALLLGYWAIPVLAQQKDDVEESAWEFDLRRAVAPVGNSQAGKAKSTLCSACHGEEGIAIVPIYPNLAGQTASYLYWNLQAYKIKRMPLSAMATLAAPLSEEDIRDLAAYYASLPAAPINNTATNPAIETDAILLAKGENIYLQGDPGKGIPPCQGCHGSTARGYPNAMKADRSGYTPFAAFPALRSQQENYLQTRLQQYHDGLFTASTNSRTMNGVAQRLDEDSIRAVSAWLASLR